MTSPGYKGEFDQWLNVRVYDDKRCLQNSKIFTESTTCVHSHCANESLRSRLFIVHEE